MDVAPGVPVGAIDRFSKDDRRYVSRCGPPNAPGPCPGDPPGRLFAAASYRAGSRTATYQEHPAMLEPARTKVGPRGRVTVPVALQRAAGLVEGAEVIIRALRPGVVIVETPQAVKDRIRAGVPPTAETASFDAVADIRALRATDAARTEHLSAPQESLHQPASGADPPSM